jgi:hypothetical protein
LLKVNRENLAIDDLVIQGLSYILGDEPNYQQAGESDYAEADHLLTLKTDLEQQLKIYVELYVNQLLRDRGILTTSEDSTAPSSKQSSAQSPSLKERDLPTPTIRPLQIGDRVLILDPDSPYYMAKLLVIRTSLIRATVETETGEHTLLKRDLRFVE